MTSQEVYPNYQDYRLQPAPILRTGLLGQPKVNLYGMTQSNGSRRTGKRRTRSQIVMKALPDGMESIEI